MATNKNDPWGECDILSSRKLSDEELAELRKERFGEYEYSLKESVQNTINSLIHEDTNIKDDSGMLIMGMDTLIRIIEEYCYE